jgi:molybdopterin converting factor small subunit
MRPDETQTEATLLRVTFYAGLVEPAGGRTVDVPWRDGTVADLRRALVAWRPRLEPLLARSAVAVDGGYAGETTRIVAGADVAILPPVSGG